MRAYGCYWILGVVVLFAGKGPGVSAATWIRPGINTNRLIWGVEGGLQFAIHPDGFRGREPRGLVRLGYPVLPGSGYDLINFIAIEPVVNGRKGFSELEKSQSDGLPGKTISTGTNASSGAQARLLDPGMLKTVGTHVEELVVILRVERFDNGAHVRLRVSQRSDVPDEIKFALHREPDSAPMDYCILTATMGNMVRARQLWLQDQTVSSLQLYPDYRDAGFAPHTVYSLERLRRTAEGDVVVAVTTDELQPARVFPFAGSERWHYAGLPVTQYWKKPAGTYRPDVVAVVNARYTYWMSRQPIPGGVAFENFELRERFFEGQQFVFGISARTPETLGWRARAQR